MNVIGVIKSPYKQKFGIPRQSGLVKNVQSELHFVESYGRRESCLGLENFSHLWVLFDFHLAHQAGWKPTVRPPRLGGQQKLGVWATRAPFRPNNIGMSIGKIENITDVDGGNVVIVLSGLDLIDQTPVYDIKPYLPYADSVGCAQAGFASEAPEKIYNVRFSNRANNQVEEKAAKLEINLRTLIENVLGYEIRAGYHKKDIKKLYQLQLYDFDIKYRYEGAMVIVESLW